MIDLILYKYPCTFKHECHLLRLTYIVGVLIIINGRGHCDLKITIPYYNAFSNLRQLSREGIESTRTN